jgi:hypothetical protein
MKEVLQIQKQLKRDQIVDTVSRMVKDMSHAEKGGMMEVPARWIKELDKLLFQLQDLENQLSN